MNVFETAALFAILCFVVQIIANVRSEKRSIRMIPSGILLIVSLGNLIYWLTGINTYDYSDIISKRETDALCQGIILAAGILGSLVAWVITFLLKRTENKGKFIAQNNKTIGTVTKVYKCWWVKVNMKAVRMHALDGAAFPRVITVSYNVEGKEYSKKKFLNCYTSCSNVNDKIEVYYDAQKPSRCTIGI